MTNTTTIPAGIRQLPHRCWELLDSDYAVVELLDGVPHFENEDTARAEAKVLAERHNITGTPRQLDVPCWSVTARCGKSLGEDVEHYESAASAEQAARDGDWTVRGGAMCCEDHGAQCQPLLYRRLFEISDDPTWPDRLRNEARAAARDVGFDAPVLPDEEIRAILTARIAAAAN